MCKRVKSCPSGCWQRSCAGHGTPQPTLHICLKHQMDWTMQQRDYASLQELLEKQLKTATNSILRHLVGHLQADRSAPASAMQQAGDSLAGAAPVRPLPLAFSCSSMGSASASCQSARRPTSPGLLPKSSTLMAERATPPELQPARCTTAADTLNWYPQRAAGCQKCQHSAPEETAAVPCWGCGHATALQAWQGF